MGYKFLQACVAALSVLVMALAGCGGGGRNAGDINPNLVTLPTATGPNSFLLFPNQVLNASGVSEIDSAEYTDAYYAAIDPNNERDTYAKWKAKNHFDDSTAGTQITVVVGDSRDLGYGRYITARKNNDGTIAFSVRNYLVPASAGYGYSTLNLDAAIAQDDRWYIGSSNIEFSPAQSGVVGFAKFFFFAPDGSRARAVNLDGRGAKWMPGPCISCHGGRADPLTPPDATGKRLFPLVQNSPSLTRGDVQGHMHPLEPDSFEYSTQAGYTRADLEAAIKTLNTWILQSYPLPFGTTPAASGVDAARRIANANEWQGTAAASVIKEGYGGYDSQGELKNPTYVDATPTGWSSMGQTSLYQNVVVPSCRVCHILRGSGGSLSAGSDIDLDSYAKFNGYADQTKSHTVDRGNMSLAKIHYEKFWSTPSIYNTMATFLEGAGYTVRDAAGAVLRPGRPLADAGPSRTVTQGATTLSGRASMYATSYQWSIVSGPANAATLSNATSRDATFAATVDGTYVVQLVVGNGTTTSDPSSLTIVVNNALTPAPSAIRFADIKAVLQAPGMGKCITCHTAANLTTVAQTPFVFNNLDRNGDAVIDATDDAWLYTEVRGRINFEDPVDSQLLLKPSGKHHESGLQGGFNTTLAPGAAGRANYDLFLNWILNGAPQ